MSLFILLNPVFSNHELKRNGWSPKLDGRFLSTISVPEIYGFRRLLFCVRKIGTRSKYKAASALIDGDPTRNSSLIQHCIDIRLGKCPYAVDICEYKKLGFMNIGRITKPIPEKTVFVGKSG